MVRDVPAEGRQWPERENVHGVPLEIPRTEIPRKPLLRYVLLCGAARSGRMRQSNAGPSITLPSNRTNQRRRPR